MLKIGSKRTFDTFGGEWKIKEIYNNKCIFTIQLNSLKCKKCGTECYEPRNYTFNHIEKIEYNNDMKYLGISSCGRYIILTDHFSKEEINSRLGV